MDIPSDAKYLYDFNFGYQGLDRLSRSFADDYGRNLEQFEVNTRVSSLILQRSFSQGSLNLFGNYYRALSPSIPHTLNKAPSLQASTLTLPLGGPLPLSLILNSAYTHYYQDAGLSGQRLDFNPKLSLATRILDTIDLTATSGWRGTGYLVDSYASREDINKYEGRSLYDVKTSVSSPIFRDWGRVRVLKISCAISSLPKFRIIILPISTLIVFLNLILSIMAGKLRSPKIILFLKASNPSAG